MTINCCIAQIGSATLPALVTNPFTIHRHGYLKTPQSRNYIAYKDSLWWPLLQSDPVKESEPQLANTGGTLGQCGVITGVREYNFPKNAMGGPLAPRPQACYQTGQIINVLVALTVHHKGHFLIKACPISPFQVPTQVCFDAYPHKFISDNIYGANFDPTYPDMASQLLVCSIACTLTATSSNIPRD